MADTHRRRVKSDDDSEGSYSESEDGNDVGTESPKETPEKCSTKRRRRRVVSYASAEQSFSESESEPEVENELKIKDEGDAPKAGESEYESAEEEEKCSSRLVHSDRNDQECGSDEQELPQNSIDEEGGQEGIAEAEEVDGDFLNGEALEDVSDDGEDYVEEERQQGDGEECSPANAVEKELDFDEDRRNPQYIPKKGIFYEHDDRINEDVKEKEQEPMRDKKKKLWLDEEKWGHDRFREDEQIPKSRGELIEIYGYDIRCEDGPPRARRRRRYGRGPTKYERNWEDVTAYGREKFRGAPRGVPRGRRPRGHFRGSTGGYRGGRGRSGYHEGGERRSEDRTSAEEYEEEVVVENGVEENEIASKETVPIINTKDFPALPQQWGNSDPKEKKIIERPPDKVAFSAPTSEPVPPLSPPPQSQMQAPKTDEPSVRTLTFENSNLTSNPKQQHNVPEYEVPPRRIKTAPFRGNYRSSVRKPVGRGGRGGGRMDYGQRRGRNTRQISPRFLENRSGGVSAAMANLSLDNVEEDVGMPMLHHHHHPGSGDGNEMLMSNVNVTELQNSTQSSKPKRYSSLRQRSMPETNAYAPPQQANVPSPIPTYYDPGYQQPPIYATPETVIPPSSQSQTQVASPPIMNPSAYQTFTASPYPDGYGLRIPVASPPRLFPQPPVAATQPILTAPPPPCIPPSPNIMNFAPPPQPPSGYHHQFAYQQYATPPPPPPPAPASDLFRGGITYYYPQSQPPPTIRPTVQKRPKAAIPILPPPERSEGKRKDKKDSVQNQSSSSNNNYIENTNDSLDPGIRTDPSSLQLQSSVGVES